LGDGSAIVVVVRREEFAGVIDASESLWIALWWCIEWSRLVVREALVELDIRRWGGDGGLVSDQPWLLTALPSCVTFFSFSDSTTSLFKNLNTYFEVIFGAGLKAIRAV
jgi:hypothetical protein